MDRIVDPSSPQVAYVVKTARMMFGGRTGNEKLFAFVPVQRGDGQYGIGVAILGESGYLPDVFSDRFPTDEDALEFTIAAHKHMGYDEDTPQYIIADTMHRSRLAREQASDKIQVKLDMEQIDHLIEALEFLDSNDTDAIDVLRDARELLVHRLEDLPAIKR